MIFSKPNRLYRYLLLALSFALFSCDGRPTSQLHDSSIVLELDRREILSVGENPFRVELTVNNGDTQRFDVEAGGANVSLGIRGIRNGETNTITITWTELLNGFPVILSVQQQEFFASSTVVLDSEHFSAQFDNDGDGVSNLDERLAGSCVWYADELCLTDGVIDVPPTGIPTSDTIPTTVDTSSPTVDIDDGILSILNEDYSAGSEPWVAYDGKSQSTDMLCLDWNAGTVGAGDIITYYSRELTMAPGDYVGQFDVLVSRQSIVAFSLTEAPLFTVIVNHIVEATTEWSTHTFSFTNNSQTSRASFGLHSVRSATPTTYCFDNVRIEQIN